MHDEKSVLITREDNDIGEDTVSIKPKNMSKNKRMRQIVSTYNV